MDPLEQVRKAVDEVLRGQVDPATSRAGFVHLYGVANICALLAIRRGLDPQIAAVAGMLHDISTYKTGDMTDHTNRSSKLAGEILTASSVFTPSDIKLICEAIRLHDEKDSIHGPLDEVLKDADVVQHYLYNPVLRANKPKHPRLVASLGELGIKI